MEWTYRDRGDLSDRKPRLAKDFRDVAVLAFLHRHPQRRLAGFALEDGHVDVRAAQASFLAGGEPLKFEHLAAKLVQVLILDITLHDREVRLGHPVSRVGQAVGKLAIVGQKHQATLIPPQASDGKEPGLGGVVDQIQHGPALKAWLIRGGRQCAFGLMKDDVELPPRGANLSGDRLAINGDLVVARVDKGGEAGDDLAIDLDPAFFDQLLAHPARGDSRVGQDALKPDKRRGWALAAARGCFVVLVVHRASLDPRAMAQVQRFQRARTENPMTVMPSSSWNAPA